MNAGERGLKTKYLSMFIGVESVAQIDFFAVPALLSGDGRRLAGGARRSSSPTG
jgi:hypothetical protein